MTGLVGIWALGIILGFMVGGLIGYHNGMSTNDRTWEVRLVGDGLAHYDTTTGEWALDADG